jgi:hypothetical protein
MPFKSSLPPRPTVVVRKKRPAAAGGTNAPPPGTPPGKKVTAQPAPSKPQAPVPPQSARPPIAPPAPPPSPQPATTPPPARDPNQPTRKQRDAQARRDLLAILRQRWPQVFPADLRLLKPWAIGLHQALAKELPDTKPAVIGRALSYLQRGGNGAYWRAVLRGGPRYNLDGTANGEVTAKDQEHAQEQLVALRAWRKAHRPARPQPEPAAPGTAAAPPSADPAEHSM